MVALEHRTPLIPSAVIFPLIHDLPRLQRVLSGCRISFDVDPAQPEVLAMCYNCWRMETGNQKAAFNAPETAAAMTKALIAARFPRRVELAALVAFLPTVERCIQDLFLQTMGGSLPLSLLCGLCAHLLGDSVMQERYAKTECIWNLNPIKQLLAQHALGIARCSQLQEDPDCAT